ncbi:MAG: hypothetical protein LC776_01400 [Acidobacteria bacterium]|nr:hypothetical protein [Acidobacteriota bacterium]
MQAILDFSSAQQAFHQRMDLAMQGISDRMAQGNGLPAEDQEMLNQLHSEMETRVGRLEAMASGNPVPPSAAPTA